MANSSSAPIAGRTHRAAQPGRGAGIAITRPILSDLSRAHNRAGNGFRAQDPVDGSIVLRGRAWELALMCSARRISTAGVLVLLAFTGCGGAPADKAGGGGGVTTLELGTPDPPGRTGSASAQHFADEVRRRSGGRLRIKII